MDYTYDGWDRLTKIENTFGRETEFEYNGYRSRRLYRIHVLGDGGNKKTSFWSGSEQSCSDTQIANCKASGCGCDGGKCTGGKAESCDGKDNDCNGLTDDQDPACFECTPGDTDSTGCDTGQPGVCSDGLKTRTCGQYGKWGYYGECSSANDPTPEA